MWKVVLSGQSGSKGIRCCNPEIGTAAPIDSSELSVQKSARTRNTQDTAEPSNSQTSNRGTQTYHPLGVKWIFFFRQRERGRERDQQTKMTYSDPIARDLTKSD